MRKRLLIFLLLFTLFYLFGKTCVLPAFGVSFSIGTRSDYVMGFLVIICIAVVLWKGWKRDAG